MEGLSMCRVCLGEDARLRSIVGTHLQEMYEFLVMMPLETTDGRPVLACYICCARLKNCYELRKSCLQSEELLTQMLSSNELTSQEIANKETLTMHNVIHLSIGHEPEKSPDNVAVEALKCEVKVEQIDPEDSGEEAGEENNVDDNIPFLDLDDDFLIIVKEEQSSDLTLKESNEASPRNPEDFTISNLRDHERVQNIFKEFIKTVASDKTAAESTNEVTFSLADNNTERPTRVPRVNMYSLSEQGSLRPHMRTHSGEKQYHCGICKKIFSQWSTLNLHMRTHTGEKPYHCKTCYKRFSQSCNLKKHMRTHTREKPYHCDICKKRFSMQTSLTKHIRTHTGEKPYHCGICKKQLSEKFQLIKHIRTHTGEKPYHCGICKKQFSEKTYLTQHIRTHTGEKPYHCGICKKKFSQWSTLNLHMRTHTGEKPYHCETCNKQFSQKCTLNKHMRTHTDKKFV